MSLRYECCMKGDPEEPRDTITCIGCQKRFHRECLVNARDLEKYYCPPCARKLPPIPLAGSTATDNGDKESAGGGPGSVLSTGSSTLEEDEQEMHLLDLELKQQVALEQLESEKKILQLKEDSLRKKGLVLVKARSRVSGGSVVSGGKRVSEWVRQQSDCQHGPENENQSESPVLNNTIQHENGTSAETGRPTEATRGTTRNAVPQLTENPAPPHAQPKVTHQVGQSGDMQESEVNPPVTQTPYRGNDTLTALFAERANSTRLYSSQPPGLLTSLHMTVDGAMNTTARIGESSTTELELLVTDSAELRARRQSRARETAKFPDLPEFDGNSARWPGFLTAFIETTQDWGIPQSANSVRLQKAVTGKARELVDDIINCASAVPLVLRYLRRAYGNATSVLRAMEAECAGHPPVEDDLNNLLSFMTKIEALCMMAKSYGQSQRYQGSALAEQMIEKLPSHIRVLRAIGNRRCGDMNLEQLLKFLDPIAEVAIVRSNDNIINGSRDVSRIFTAISSGAKIPSLNSSTVERDRATGACRSAQDEYPCPAECEEVHGLSSCPRFLNMSPPQRLNLTRRKRVCWTCLACHKRGCGIDVRCQCGVCHHPLLHDALTPDRSDEDLSI